MAGRGSRIRRISGPISRAQWLVCAVSGHRWDVAPKAGVSALRCVRCGMTAEPVTPR